MVPGLLVVVGLVQFSLSHTVDLSPWKGGGFGMFAAIDSPSMRVLAAEGLSTEGELLYVDVLRSLDPSTRQRIRSLPRESDLPRLAEQLLGQEVVPVGFQQQVAHARLSQQNPQAASIPQIPPSSFSWAGTDAIPVYRLKRSSDPVLGDRPPQTLKAVRLQWWRLRFNPETVQLVPESLSSPIERGTWP